jgi:hypothetical protein
MSLLYPSTGTLFDISCIIWQQSSLFLPSMGRFKLSYGNNHPFPWAHSFTCLMATINQSVTSLALPREPQSRHEVHSKAKNKYKSIQPVMNYPDPLQESRIIRTLTVRFTSHISLTCLMATINKSICVFTH